MASLREKIPVPELAPNRAVRIEQRVLHALRLEPRSARVTWASGLRWAAAGLVVAGVAVAIVLNLRGATRGATTIAVSNPPVEVEPVITEITTGSDGTRVVLGDAAMWISPDTELSISRGSEIGVELRRGRVDCDVAPAADRTEFWVRAGDVTATVVGTVFAVDRTGDVRVEVDRGQVMVESPEGKTVVEAGRMWTVGVGLTALLARATPDEAVVEDLTEVEVDGVGEVDGGREVALGSRARRLPDERRSPREPESTSVPEEDQPAPAEAPVSRLPRPPRLSPPSRPAELLEAMSVENSDPREAVRVYGRLAREERGALASFALYSKAYVEYLRLGDRSSALRTIDLFFRRFPRARESGSALWLKVKALCDAGRVERCRAAAYRYLDKHGSGRFADQALAIVRQ